MESNDKHIFFVECSVCSKEVTVRAVVSPPKKDVVCSDCAKRKPKL